MDHVTVELIRNAFMSAALDMKASLVRSAYSPVIYEAQDCAVGLFTKDMEILGQAPGLPFFIGALDETLRVVAEIRGIEEYCDGDVYLVNDSYICGSHLNDVTVFAPIFSDGDLVGFAATKAHWRDVGASNAGMSIGASEIYQEGLRLGPVKLVDSGRMVEDLVSILTLNTRMPQALLGDAYAQIAACRMGSRRYREIIHKYGHTKVMQCMKTVFDATELMEREAIENMPDGVYHAEAEADGDLVDDSEFPVRVKVTIKGSNIIVDTRGSSGVRKGCTNTGLTQSKSGLRLAYKFLVRPDIGVTGGSFRPLEMLFDVPSAFAAQEPAACFGYGGAVAIDLVIRALAPIIPNDVTAGGPGSSWNVSMVGWDSTKDALFISGEALAGGWGANASSDGNNAIIHMDAGDFKNTPVETAENRYPVRITGYRLGTDTGGAGKFRGGLNVVKSYMNLAETTMLGIQFGRTITPSWGLFDGEDGSIPRVSILPGRAVGRTLSKVHQLPLHPGDTFEAHTGGGGGYGPPWEREVWRVQEDIAEGYVSLEEARSRYGVIFVDNSQKVDIRATNQARKRLASSVPAADRVSRKQKTM